MALGYAGVALAVLALIIPSLLTWQSRKHNPQAGYRVKGGRPALVVVFLCGIAVIGVQFLIAAGLLPEVGGLDSYWVPELTLTPNLTS